MKKRTKKTVRPARHRKTSSRGVAGGRGKRTVKKTKKRKPSKKRVKHLKHKKQVRAVRHKTFVGKGILEQLFESQAKVKLMKFFFRNAEEFFPLKDILKMLRINAFTLRREIKNLERIDLIKKTKKQKKIVYCLNAGFDFFKELKDLILKSTISSKDELVNNVRKIGNIKLLVLAGIFRGNEGAGADLLIVGDKVNQRKFSTFLKDLEAEVGKELNCALMSAKEFNYRYDMYDRFVRDLISESSDVLINKLNLW